MAYGVLLPAEIADVCCWLNVFWKSLSQLELSGDSFNTVGLNRQGLNQVNLKFCKKDIMLT